MNRIKTSLGVVLVISLVSAVLAGAMAVTPTSAMRTSYHTFQVEGPARHQLRSDSDPDVVGNIFEFAAEAGEVADAPQSRHTGRPGVIMEVMDPSLDQFAPLWQKEIGRQFNNAVGVLCHGGEFINGQWIVSAKNYGKYQTAQELIKHFQAEYPDRVIVLLACNPAHLKLGIPGVYYAHSSVWCIPDRQVDASMSQDQVEAKL
jgi:hypothetical protein